MFTDGIRKILDGSNIVGAGGSLNRCFEIADDTYYMAINFNGDIYIKDMNDDWTLTCFKIDDFKVKFD